MSPLAPWTLHSCNSFTHPPTHRVRHLPLVKLLGEQAEALARLRAPGAPRALRGLHPAAARRGAAWAALAWRLALSTSNKRERGQLIYAGRSVAAALAEERGPEGKRGHQSTGEPKKASGNCRGCRAPPTGTGGCTRPGSRAAQRKGERHSNQPPQTETCHRCLGVNRKQSHSAATRVSCLPAHAHLVHAATSVTCLY